MKSIKYYTASINSCGKYEFDKDPMGEPNCSSYVSPNGKFNRILKLKDDLDQSHHVYYNKEVNSDELLKIENDFKTHISNQ
ncbi:hypothetical protein KW868_02605 [Acinetobacter guillouiae]|uniref:Uncharacterized protein n=1 Tax=Acinetobacter guillouiae TaxID=106649 RepID=A0A8X8KE10_ACIGI|nr:hypothetical protein [Acinetobacter guillouiae]MCF0263366.1 hypothetical protein [Acinetobacter guillouiae]